jgi:hypothetical protein
MREAAIDFDPAASLGRTRYTLNMSVASDAVNLLPTYHLGWFSCRSVSLRAANACDPKRPTVNQRMVLPIPSLPKRLPWCN